MRHLFPSFDGPVRASPYFCVQRRQRGWPLVIAFIAGMTCVFAVAGPWRYMGDRSSVPQATAPAAANEGSQTVSAQPIDAVSPVTTAAPVAEPEAARANSILPQPETQAAAPAKEHPVAGGNTGPTTARASHATAPNTKMIEARRPITNLPNSKTASAAESSSPDQAAGMVRIDEEELPDGRRVPVYRRPTIFDSVRPRGSE